MAPNPPHRLQRRRERGFRLPPGTVCCTRPGIFGNPFVVEIFSQDEAVRLHRLWLTTGEAQRLDEGDLLAEGMRDLRAMVLDRLPSLRGKNLACFCRLCPEHRDGKPFGVTCEACAPCHVDELLIIANAKVGS